MKRLPIFMTGRINIVKISILTRVINKIPIKIPIAFFTEIEINTPRIYREAQNTQISTAILGKKNKVGGITETSILHSDIKQKSILLS
jgi:hypothetical protein